MSDQTTIPPEVQRVLDEVAKIKGDFIFQMKHASQAAQTIGNTTNCNSSSNCSVSNSMACHV
jgi:hypothetical protein